MAQLNRKTIKQIDEIIDNTPLSRDTFNVKTGEIPSPILEILFKANSNYYFQIKEQVYADGYTVIYSPGYSLVKQQHSDLSLYKCFELIPQWVNYLITDLKVQSPSGTWDKIWKQFQEEINEMGMDEVSVFTFIEKEELLRRVKDLEVKLETILRDNDAGEEEIDKMTSTFENIKENLEYMPKATWYRNFGGKVYAFGKRFSNTKIGQLLVAEVAKEGIQSLIHHVEPVVKELAKHF